MQNQNTTQNLVPGTNIPYTASRSSVGWTVGPEYQVAYRLRDGRWLVQDRATDRGDAVLGERIVASEPRFGSR